MLTQQDDGSVRIEPELAKAIEEVSLFVLNRPILDQLVSERRDKYAAAALVLSLAAAQCS